MESSAIPSGPVSIEQRSWENSSKYESIVKLQFDKQTIPTAPLSALSVLTHTMYDGYHIVGYDM